MNSSFDEDLSKEVLLGKYLDGIYATKFPNFEFKRVSDINLQHQGIDLTVSHNGSNYYIDEKAQLDYIGGDLPTFTFEISYMKNRYEHQGWLFDSAKKTHKYFLITGISLNDPNNIHKGFAHCKITSVDRTALKRLLESKGLTQQRIMALNNEIQAGKTAGKIPITELDQFNEGNFHHSTQKAESPINIVMRLDYLIKSGAAKRIYP